MLTVGLNTNEASVSHIHLQKKKNPLKQHHSGKTVSVRMHMQVYVVSQ